MFNQLDQPIKVNEQGEDPKPLRARDISKNEGLTKLQALQRVLYQSAKQDSTRRFHALHDKGTRSDVMWQAWVNVAINQDAPGIDGVSIDDIKNGGVEGIKAFLENLASEVKAKTYRPQPLRRVNM